jgi:hypothetical protein
VGRIDELRRALWWWSSLEVRVRPHGGDQQGADLANAVEELVAHLSTGICA